MFSNILSMMGNYEDRKVARHDDEETGLMVSTAAVYDSTLPYETAVAHPAYNDDEIVIVEMYPTNEKARVGHERWVARMVAPSLPSALRDVSTSEFAEFIDAVSDGSWRKFPKAEGIAPNA